MHSYTIFCLLILFASIIHYLNIKWLHLSSTIAITACTLIIALLAMGLHAIHVLNIEQHLYSVISAINFHEILLNGMLGPFLFAGALTVNIQALRESKWEVALLAFFSTLLSTFLVGLMLFALNALLNLNLSFLLCCLFGAIISPTDPVAVLAIVSKIKAPESLTVKIAGESLFNDGVGLVLFVTLSEVIFHHGSFSISHTVLFFLQQAIGGMAFGYLIAKFACWIIKPLSNHQLELLITLCIATSCYVFAQNIGISGPLAMVVSGLMIGNKSRQGALSAKGKQHLDIFWHVIDEILNAILFMLIGLEVLTIHFKPEFMLTGLLMIPIILAIRFLTVALPIASMRKRKKYVPYIISILTWGGLRGGLAVAMALSLPKVPQKPAIVAITFMVVVFSILVQGTTAGPVVALSKQSQMEN